MRAGTRVVFLCGSRRDGSASRAVCATLIDALPHGSGRLVEIGALPLYDPDLAPTAEVGALLDGLTTAHGAVLVTPEYNHSISGVLKNAIDWASRPYLRSPLRDRPCLPVTVSGGGMGGVRAMAHLRQVLHGVMARAHPGPDLLVPDARAKVADGRLGPGPTRDRLEAGLAAFAASLPDRPVRPPAA